MWKMGFAAGAMIVAATAMPAAASVEVIYSHPEEYTDATAYDSRSSRAREPILADLSRHLTKLGARYLQPGQDLKIEVTDIDLAGRFEPWRFKAQDVRFLTDSTWPRIQLHYELRGPTGLIASAEDSISDPHYLMGARLSSSDRLYYEKAMLDSWFRDRFATR
jgi:hypothetical protein